MNLNWQLRKRRVALGLSQERLSWKVGCHIATLGQIERGRVEPGSELKARIAEVLSCSIEDIFTGEDIPDSDDLVDRIVEANRRLLAEFVGKMSDGMLLREAGRRD